MVPSKVLPNPQQQSGRRYATIKEMESIRRITAHRTVRFVLVGATNTAINFVILNACFYTLHLNRYLAAFTATVIAVAISFVLNRSFVFGSHDRPVKQLVMFIVVTLSGVLLVQNALYALSNWVIAGHETWLIDAVHAMVGLKLGTNFVDINVSNVVGAIGAMVWNYNGYRLFVFKDKKEALHEAIAEAA
jgi:putative flippase GtrA